MCIYTADGPQRERVKASVKAKIASSWQNVQSTSSQLVRHVLMHRKKYKLIWYGAGNVSSQATVCYRVTLYTTLFVTSLYELQSPAVLLATKKWGIISRRFENGFFFFGPWFLSDIWHNLLLRSGNTIQQFRDIILNSGSQLFGPQVERTNSSSVGSGSNKDEYHFIFFIALFYLKKTGMT